MIKIGSYKIDTDIIMAPLAGCTDLPFRLIAREHGAKFCFYEMLDANSLTHRTRTCRFILKTDPKDTPVAAQLLGNDPSVMLDAAQILLSITPSPFLDINFACPARKVIKKKAGGYLVKDEKALSEILKKLSKNLPIPITVKLRTGFDRRDEEHMANIAKSCEDSGAKAIFVHGRSVKQGYSGDVDYDMIRVIKNSVSIPVVGVGNVFSGESAKLMFDRTGCDGICVARGALGNPWIFEEIDSYLKDGKTLSGPTIKSRIAVAKKHLRYMQEYLELDKKRVVGPMRKVAIWYMKQFESARIARSSITRAKTAEAIIDIVNDLEKISLP